MVYNLIREFTRAFECRFIVTGSYLGRILNEEFKLSAGDLTSLRVETLTFEEFAAAFGLDGMFKQTGLFGESASEDYDALKELYELYCQTGGYPAVVTEYLETRSLQKCREKLEDVIHLFCSESIRYFDDILDAAVYDNLFCSVPKEVLQLRCTQFHFIYSQNFGLICDCSFLPKQQPANTVYRRIQYCINLGTRREQMFILVPILFPYAML